MTPGTTCGCCGQTVEGGGHVSERDEGREDETGCAKTAVRPKGRNARPPVENGLKALLAYFGSRDAMLDADLAMVHEKGTAALHPGIHQY